MQMTNRDFSMYYNHSIFLYPVTAREVLRPFYVREILHGNERDRFHVTGAYITQTGKVVGGEYDITPAKISYGEPHFGYVNTSAGMVEIQRPPQRRPKKGLDREGVAINGLGIDFRIHPELDAISRQAIWGLYFPKFPTVEQAIKSLSPKVLTAAITPEISIKRTPTGGVSVYYGRLKVGKVVEERLVLARPYGVLDSVLQQAGFNVTID